MEVDQPDRLEKAPEGSLTTSAAPAHAAEEDYRDHQAREAGDSHAGAASGPSATNPSKRGNGGSKGKTADTGKSKGKNKAKQTENHITQVNILEKLAESPYSSELHLEHIASAKSDEEREEARSFMAQMVPLSDGLWLDWIHDRKARQGDTLEGKIEVLELFKRACNDNFSIKLHQEYARYVLATYYEARGYKFPDVLDEDEMSGQRIPADENAAAVFDEDFVDGEMTSAVSGSVRWHLSEGQSVWLILHGYRLLRLRRNPSEEAVEEMERFYLERLREPHVQLPETFQLFSSFISTFKNASYEESLVTCQPIYNATKAIADLREVHEDRLSAASRSVESFQAYLAWEQEVPKPNFMLVKVLFERAIATFPFDSGLWQGLISFLTRATKKPQSVAGAADLGWSLELLLEVYQKATRYLPFSGSVVSECIRGIESLCEDETALSFSAAQYDRVMEATDSRLNISDLVSIVISRADVVRHLESSSSDNRRPSPLLVSVLQDGTTKVKSLFPDTGDHHLRIEKYLLRQYERSEDWNAIDAFLASLAQSYPTSALVLTTRIDYLLRQNKLDTVRKLFQSAAKKRYDYPEFVFDAWVNFEHRDGSLSSLEKALATIAHEMTFVHARRSRENRLQLKAVGVPTDAESDGLEISGVSEQSKKRRLDEDSPLASASALRGEVAPQEVITKGTVQELKRDRENSTVSVTGLITSTHENDIRNLFRDCGPIREVKVRALADQAVATVEFLDKESVPAALTKDKKRIGRDEVHVAPVWQSTLYVTNFPDTFDAADIQNLFEPFGVIFETRWPSRRLKATRRFVYIQYIDEGAAERALSLHNTVIHGASDQRIQVHISDPLRKKTRTDVNVTKRELYVTGLPKQATETDLEKLFVPFGNLRGSRVLKDDAGQCRGIGFVDFETEESASAALSMNNYEYKRRRLGVVLADSRISQKAKPTASGQGQQADARNRSVTVHGLPANAEEPLVQQFFDRYGRTRSVEIQGAIATVIFEDPADAAKLLLVASEVDYNGAHLTIKEGTDRSQWKETQSSSAAKGASSWAPFLPRVNRGRGKKLGVGAARTSQNHMEVDPQIQAGKDDLPTAGSMSDKQEPNPHRSQADFKAMLLGGRMT